MSNPATRTVTWTYNTSLAGPYFYVLYSTDGGATWTYLNGGNYVTGSAGNGSYTWTVPNTPTTNALVKVIDYYNDPCRNDISDAPFTISSPTPVLTLTAPNGGNIYYVGSSYNITWTSQYLTSSFVKLEYSIDNGTNWIVITNATNNDGTETWITPNNPSTTCLVRVSEYGNPSLNDVSNAVFSIVAPYITVNAPNGSETWNGCTSQTISWTGYGTSGPYMVEYSIDGGTNWSTLVSSTSSTSYSWATVPNINSSQTLVRVSLVSNSAVNDISNAAFNLSQQIHIIVNSPNGGEVWQCNNPATRVVNWAYNPANSGPYFYLYYSTNGGSTWTALNGGNYVTGSGGNGNYTWTIPNTPSNNCLIKVEDYYSSCKYDVSDLPFTITAPTPNITVTYPNGNETLYGFNTTSIQWTSAYISSSFVKIEYSIDSGATWLLISGSASNNGVYSWTVPNITTTKALVRVTDYGNNATYDVSNAVFTIKPAVVVTAPNGGENLSGCTVTTITWNGEGSSGSYLLQYSVNGGTSWNTIVSQTFSASPATLYSYNWTLPNTPSNYCLVRVTNNNNTSKVDQSDAVFNILPTITVTNPNNGGSYSIGSTLNITWASQGVSNYYNIEYSTNGGSVWNTITFNTYITTNSYAWTVPNAPSTNCYIRVTDNNNNCKQDINDVAFTISTTPPAITVTSPNGGENITACSTRDITWSANGTSGSYTIEYSSNNGSTWTTLVSNYATTNGTYSWTVPSVATTQGLIRVKDFANASLIDQSNSVFAISVLATPGTITGSATACEGSSQTYSIALVSGATSYTWTLPAGWSGSSTSNTISVIAGSASGNISVVANNTCGSSSASTKAVTVSPLPATPGSISTTNSSPCTGNTVTYSIAAVSGATSYSWILPSGFSGSSTTTSIAVLIGANPGVIQVSANNSCGSGGVSSLTVTPNGSSLPATPTSISGTLAPCAGTSQTYSILPVAGATSYSWTLPAGWSGSSSTNSINVTSGSVGGNISVTANNACGTSAAQTLTVSITNVPAQPGTISGNASVCLNSANTYTISAVSGAGNYTWSLPSGWSGASTSTSINSVATGITGSVQVTANNACGSSTPRTLAVTVNSPVTPTVTASTTASGTICANASITFTATQTTGGTPTYQWIKNNVAVGTNSAFYTATGWSNNDSVWVIMTSSSTCLTTATATSNKIYLSVNPNVTPTISISASTTSICANGSVAFTSSITNGGASPTYQWKKNGVNISGATSSTYSTTSLANGDAITCLLTSTATCASPANVTSNSISITVTSNVTPTVTIVASPSGAICAGTSVTFTATPTNGGTTPTYVWTVNGYFAGNGSTYTASNLIQSDTVRCQLTSNVSCVTTPTANSNAIIMTVNQYVNPVVTISANNNPICTGQAVTFTATPTNGGASPTYQWYKNNALISGATLATYTASGIVANDSFFVRMVSNYSCLNTTVDTSNVIAIAVTGSVTPSVTIAVSPNDTVCAGTSLTFTATPLNGGSTPTYVWKKNGTTISGATAATYTVTTLVNNDVITVVMTSSSSCASPTTATSNAITITVNANVTASVTASGAPVSPICSGTSVTFTATPTNGGVSPSYQWRLNGSAISGQTGSTYTTTSLASGDVVSVQMSSSAQCATPTTATSGNLTYTVNPVLVPGVTVTAGSNPICAGSSTTFTATPLNGGTPTYQWKKNGTNVGTGLVTYSPTTLNDGDSVWVVMTSTATCATPTTVTSNKVIISTTPTVTPSVSISVSPANSICSGQSVTFTATPTNGGTTPTYVWKKNGTTIAGATASTYTSTALVNNDVITVVMTSNANCASPATATSNAITMSVSSNSAPTVSIAALPTGAICSGTSVTFTATPTNGGATPTYDWRVNGVSTGVTTATYTSASLANTNQISCVLTSSLTCVTTTTATSNTITMTVNPVLTPSVLISTPNQTICAGTSVTFTAAPTNGGTPTYVWKKNGTSVGVTTSTYTTTTIANNDIVTVEMTSTAACASPATVTSNSIAMTVNPAVTPTISISANQTSICAGNTVSFTSTVTNGGAGPSYQWKKNGTNISGATAATYSSASLVNNDVITCVLTSNANCASPATATSNTVTITVVTNATPTVSISASANPACSGLPVTFTATPVNGGSTPAYDWKLNGTSTGITTATYTTSSLVTGNQVSCVMTSSLSCVSTSSATSNTVTMTVNPTVTPSVLITTPNNSVCSGVNVTFTAAPTNGGTTPGYQWKKNGINISGANSVTYSSSTLANGDIITVEMTSTATCASPAVVTSNSIVLTVTTSVTPSISIAANPSGAVCTGTSVSFTATPINGGITPGYQWKKNGTNISGATTSTYSSSSLVSGDVITCQLTSSAACATPAVVTSSGITMTVNAVVTPTVSISANTGTSICSGTNVTFTATVTNGGATPTYQWKLNGNVVGIGSTYSNAALSNGDAVTCDIVSNAVCVTQSTATSNTLTMSVSGSVNPTIAISASTGNTICSGTSVVFSSLITGGGSTPAYQWRKGGVAISGATSATYTTSTLANNDAITCVLTSSAGCASPASVTSNTITMSVSNTVTASVSINASATSVCSGTNISFAATPVNGGANPVYNWKVNGVSTGVSGAVYTSSSLSSGDVVSCDMSSTLNCVTPALTTSNAITITVNPVVTPSVSISTPNTTICSGTSVSFTATSVNGGANPVYTWKVNGNSVGSSANFTSASLNNSDIITCDLTSNAACITQTNASSNAITMTVTSSVTPTINISANPGSSVCAGTPVTFTATATNGGATPVYQWKKNGSFVGSNSDTYNASNLNNNDVISVTLTSSSTCAIPASVTNTLTMTIKPIPTAPTASANSPMCEGNVLQLSCASVAGASSYEWSGPVSYQSFLQNPTITGASTVNSGTYSVVVTVNGCSSQPGTVNVVINAKPATPTISQNGNVLTSSAASSYQWYLNSGVLSGATQQSYTVTQTGWYSVEVSNTQSCSSISDSLYVVATSIEAVNLDKVINIVPNPFSTQFEIKVSTSVQNMNGWSVTITDELGRQVYVNRQLDYINYVDLSNHASGIYFVNLNTGKERRTFKVVKTE
ncbi:MAG: T9SS type A sorting domain-containing protein [Chitinophagales bacterium]